MAAQRRFSHKFVVTELTTDVADDFNLLKVVKLSQTQNSACVIAISAASSVPNGPELRNHMRNHKILRNNAILGISS